MTMTRRCYSPGRVLKPAERTHSRNLNSGNACAWKPSNGGAGPFAVRRWLKPTGNWTAPDHRKRRTRSPEPSKRSAPRERRRSLRPLGRSRV